MSVPAVCACALNGGGGGKLRCSWSRTSRSLMLGSGWRVGLAGNVRRHEGGRAPSASAATRVGRVDDALSGRPRTRSPRSGHDHPARRGDTPVEDGIGMSAERLLSARDVRTVIFASSLGTMFESYDFYLYGSLAAIISKQFFSGVNPTAAFIFALLAFAAGFAVRPFGALVFGRLGDLVGRKYTFLVTILIMGVSTFVVGVLPGSASIGIVAPIILIGLRLMQGLALGGEYGGAA